MGRIKRSFIMLALLSIYKINKKQYKEVANNG
nr:MAG TPA: hypothetical protein [Caudoviricetes sp.]